MKRIIFLLSLLLITGSVIWGQGQITRPKKTEPTKKETPKQNATNNTNGTVKSVLPNSIETINGITVKWNEVTHKQKEIITELINNLVFVEGGKFIMGSVDSDAFSDEMPLHSEEIKSFMINKYETTQKLWNAIMENNPSNFKGDNLPVENLNFDQCISFIDKLNRITGLKFRLPTEAEWEYAARGGNQSKNFKFSGDNSIDNVGWHKGNSNRKTHTVGSKKCNELGLYDMSGNVREITTDFLTEYYGFPPDKYALRVYRGGSWAHEARASRISCRSPHTWNIVGDTGFRLVL